MAQGQQNANELWASAAASAGFAVHNGAPLIGISPDEGDGYIVELPAPDWFSAIRDEGTRENVFRAMAGHALRVAQAKVKAKGTTPSLQVATDAAASALNGGYKPGRGRDNDIVDSQAMAKFRELVVSKVRAVNPQASDKDIDATVDQQLKTDRGKELIGQFRNAVLESRTYTVARKGSGGKAAAVAVSLD